MMEPSERRDFLLYYARVMLREARARRKRSPDFAAFLLDCAARARREAQTIDTRPAQGDLFGLLST
jgi:hypothetical protein